VICKRCQVSGRVQGVSFRAGAARLAAQLGVTGHAVNLADGRVEVLACGPADAVEALIRWLRTGPRAARVDAVVVDDCPSIDRVPLGFTTG
jgi:acylphosphatase